MQTATEVLNSLTVGIVSRDHLPACGDFMHFLAETHCLHEQYMSDSPELYQSDTRQFLASLSTAYSDGLYPCPRHDG
jgi:IS1 family transposase